MDEVERSVVALERFIAEAQIAPPRRDTDQHFRDDILTARIELLGLDRPGISIKAKPTEATYALAAEVPWFWADDSAFCPEGRRSTHEELARELPTLKDAA